jgi:RNA polymerase sigma-70 factor (ECF subfamily)
MLDTVRDQLAQMKPDRATAVFLHDVLGHELAEIALMQQISVAAAQSRLVRGRKELERRLQNAKKRGVVR